MADASCTGADGDYLRCREHMACVLSIQLHSDGDAAEDNTQVTEWM